MANFEDLIIRDTRANQPAAGVAGRLYYVSDESVLERDNGSTWDDVSSVTNDAELTAIAALTSAANKIIRYTGSGTADLLDFLDEDNMASDSASALASQQSIKAYVDAAGGGGLTSSVTTLTPTTANDTATVTDDINFHFADVSGMTTDRSFVVPAGTAKQEIILNITTGDDTYEYVIIGDTGITINGGSAATEWSRLFITGESIRLVATSATNWQVVHDGRIPCEGKMTLSADDTTNSAGTDTLPTWDNAVINVGNVCDTANYRFNIRRAGNYSFGGVAYAANGLSDAEVWIIRLKVNSTTIISYVARASGASGNQSAGGSTEYTLAVGDAVYLYYLSGNANRGIDDANSDFWIKEE